MIEFRKLNKEETEVLTGSVDQRTQTVTLLIYKTAQGVEDILDEAVGGENWYFTFEDKEFEVDKMDWNSRQTVKVKQIAAVCNIHIYNPDTDKWIVKTDIGSLPDNAQKPEDKVKALYSDAIKRAGTVAGIGRELYSVPKIQVPLSLCNVYNKDGKSTTYDSFSVDAIGYNELGKVNYIVIRNDTTGKIVYTYDIREITDEDVKAAEATLKAEKITVNDLLTVAGKKEIKELRKCELEKLLTPNGIKLIKEKVGKGGGEAVKPMQTPERSVNAEEKSESDFKEIDTGVDDLPFN